MHEKEVKVLEERLMRVETQLQSAITEKHEIHSKMLTQEKLASEASQRESSLKYNVYL